MNTRLLQTFRVVLLAFVSLWSISASAQQVSIGATSGTTSYFYGPYYRSSATSSFNYSNYGYLYTATELGIPAGSTITQIEWLKASGTLTGNNTFNIWLENTSNATMPASITWGNLIASATQVYSSTTQSFSAGANSYESFTLTTPFTYSGGNLIISTEHIKSGTASAANNFYVNTATNMAVGIANSAATTTTTSLTTTGGYGNNRPTIRITYVPGVACSGNPSVGTLTAPPATCPGVPFTISHIGYTAASGLTFLWEESPAGANTWSPVTGGTNPSLSVAGITTPTDYRVTVTCTNGGAFDVSTTVSVGVNPVTQCYCTPIYTTACTVGDDIDDVILLGDVAPGINNLNTPCPPGGYADYTSMSATLNAGFTYSGNVTTNYGSTSEDVNIFIDYNANGVFEASESVATLENISNTSSGAFSFTVPAATPAGSYRMRVRLVYGTTATSIDPCNSVTYGEAHDYTINVVIPAACAGIPSTPVASGPSSVCPNQAISLSATGYSVGTGLTFQWESFDINTNAWVPVPGATLPNFVISAGQTTATDYRFVTTCSNGGGQSFSNTVSIGMSSFNACYCSPLNGTTLHSTVLNYITNVEILGTTLNNPSTTVGAGGYTQYIPTTATTTTNLDQGLQYTINVTHPYTGYYGGAWIDWDQSGTMDAGEFISLTTSGLVSSGTFIVPYTATAGLTGLRVRMNYNPITSGQPCNNIGYETEDYLVNIIQALPCSGTPNVVTAIAPATVCSGADFTLTATNYSTGLGITYEWQYYDVNTTLWTAVSATANTPMFVVTGGITTPTDYRFVTTCGNGGGQDISNTVSVGMSPFYSCYCIPTNAGSAQITNVTIGGTSFNNTSGTAPAPTYYNSFPATGSSTASLTQGTIYPISATFDGSAISSVWIDYNQNGIFEATEWIQLGLTGTSHSGTLSVPLTALTGQTGMRVRSRGAGNVNGATDACLNMGGGETEDYVITIVQAVACSGTPNTTVVTGPTDACAATPFTLVATGYSTGLGISYQWEFFNTATSTWDPMPGTNTNPSYQVTNQTTATDYRFVTTCSNGGGSSTSNTLSVSQNAPNQCYCTPVYTTACSVGDDIDDVILLGDVAPGINNLNTPCPANGYQDYTAMSASLSQGLTYSGNVTTNYTGASEDVRIWIDFDQNGAFDASESVATLENINNASTGAFTITIPSTTPIGSYRMRVRLVYGTTATSIDPCTSVTYGEAHDYTINVTAPPACMAPGNLAASVTGSTANVSWDPVTNASGYEWAVDQTSTPAPDASTTIATSTTTTPAAVTGLTASSTYYLHVRTDCGSVNGYSAWAVYSFSTPPANDECVNAINISNSQLYNGVTTGAIQTMAACDATSNANDVWYTITTGSVGGSVTVNVNTTVGDIVMEAFSGTCGSFTGLVPTASSNSATTSCVDQVALGLDWATYTFAANTTYYVRVYGYNGANSTFTIEALGTPLAVKLADISVTNVGNRNRVDWITASETAGDRFELERSADGRNFTQLSTINARGEASTYSYWDEKPVAGINYYRLKMMDAAGSFTYSDVVTAKVAGSGAFTVEAYPNPVSEMLTVKVYGAAGNNPTVSVSDITGKVVKVVTVTNNEATINMSGLAQGMYLVKYTDNNNTETIKVNKK